MSDPSLTPSGQNNDTPMDFTAAINAHILRENYNLGLNFQQGYIFFRVNRREFVQYIYDPFAEITNFAGAGNVDMPSGLYITAKELPSISLNTTDIFKVDDPTHIYQCFWGVSPGMTRVFPAFPRATEINQLDEGIHTPNYPAFGFISGFESPISLVSPRTEFFVPIGPLPGFAFYNPAPYNIKPMMRIIINRMQVEPIKSADLVTKILERRVECRLASVGGVDNPWGDTNADYIKNWGVLPIKLLA